MGAVERGVLESSRALEVYLVLGNDFPQSTTEKQQQAKITPTLTSPNSNAFKSPGGIPTPTYGATGTQHGIVCLPEKGCHTKIFRTGQEDDFAKAKERD